MTSMLSLLLSFLLTLLYFSSSFSDATSIQQVNANCASSNQIQQIIGNAGKTLNSVVCQNLNIGGAFPNNLGDFSSIFQINVQNNKIQGPLPDSISKLTNLFELALETNELRGTIPKTLGSLKELGYLGLANNAFFGTVPTEIGLLTTLTYLDLGNNPHLSGTIPTQIGFLTKLGELRIGACSFKGKIPTEIALLTSLSLLNVNVNFFTGTMPFNTATSFDAPIGAQLEIFGAGTPRPSESPTGDGEGKPEGASPIGAVVGVVLVVVFIGTVVGFVVYRKQKRRSALKSLDFVRFDEGELSKGKGVLSGVYPPTVDVGSPRGTVDVDVSFGRQFGGRNKIGGGDEPEF